MNVTLPIVQEMHGKPTCAVEVSHGPSGDVIPDFRYTVDVGLGFVAANVIEVRVEGEVQEIVPLTGG